MPAFDVWPTPIAAQDRAGLRGKVRRISTEELQRERSVENYLRGALMPRWMERLREIQSGTSATARG